jgi:hypothetical protein
MPDKTTQTDQWATPRDVSDMEMAFPANAVRDFMPSYEECKEGLRKLDAKTEAMWRDFQATWFFSGLPDNVRVKLAPGIDGEAAFRHLSCIQGSYAPSHQHKEAAVAYLASRWFRSVKGYKKTGS